jgi:hypothetical protein
MDQDADAKAAMLANLEDRAKRPDRENLAKETLDEYPLLAGTSMMHYIEEPDGPDDFPGFDARVQEWGDCILKGVPVARDHGREPFVPDYYNMLSGIFRYERICRLQRGFMDLVVKHTHLDIIGRWQSGTPAYDTLAAFCAHSPPIGMLLMPVPRRRLPFEYLYSELDLPDSRLLEAIRRLRNHQPIFYLLDFSPSDIFKIRRLYPRARIVGIAQYDPLAEAQCLALLKQQIAQTAGPKK